MKLFRFVIVLVSALALPQLGRSQTTDWDPMAVLGVPGSPLGRGMIEAPESFRYYLNLSGRYDTNIGGPVEESTPDARSESVAGGEAGWGVVGVRQRPRDWFSIDYNGAYRLYGRGFRRGGDSHRVSLNYVRLISSRTQIYVAPSVGRYSYATVGYRNPLGYDPLDEFSDPTAGAFDIRTDSAAVAAGVYHLLSRTVSVNLSGSGYIARREDPRFLDSQGTSASASITKNLGPSVAIGGSYRFTYYFYLNGYGESQIHSVNLTYNQQLTEFWNLNASFGASRVESDRLVAVAVDPIVAAITGQNRFLQAANRLTIRPTGGATLSRRFERATLSFYYRRGIDSGNEFLTTSFNESGGISYSYTATEKLSAGLNVTVSRRGSHLDNIGSFATYGGGIGMGYRLWRFIHFSARAQIRRWDVEGALKRNRLGVNIGLTFSPGERPVPLY